jgi:hypothetical protein
MIIARLPSIKPWGSQMYHSREGDVCGHTDGPNDSYFADTVCKFHLLFDAFSVFTTDDRMGDKL